MRITLVCFGNICRSPMAAAILSRYLGADFQVTSAGIGALQGNRSSAHAVEALKEMGLDISSHRARYFDKEIANQSDLILVMEQRQKEFIERMFKKVAAKTFLLSSFVSIKEEDVSDPIGSSLDFYRQTAQKLDSLLKKAANKIKKMRQK